jgi:hypothetical protein
LLLEFLELLFQLINLLGIGGLVLRALGLRLLFLALALVRLATATLLALLSVLNDQCSNFFRRFVTSFSKYCS